MPEPSIVSSPAGLLQASPDAFLLVTPDRRISLANSRAERLFGYRASDLVGNPSRLLFPDAPEYPAEVDVARYRQAPAADLAVQELRGRRRDGRLFPAEVAACTVDTPEGPMVAVTVRDATARNQVLADQARFAAIVRSSQDAIISKTPDGLITTWNPAAERIYGYRAEEIIGRSVFLLVPTQRRIQQEELLARTLAAERVERFRTERLRKDGSLVRLFLTSSPIIDQQGKIVGIASISHDLSEQELAEAKFRAVLDAAPDAMVGVGADGRIVLVNAQAERMFRSSRTELLGKPVEVLVPREQRAGHVRLRQGYMPDPRPRPMGAGMQLTATRLDGAEFPAEISLSAVESEDGLLVLTAIRDISERLAAQAERERLRAQAERERMESRMAQAQRLESLGELAGGVAHDFNNLLAVILNYTCFVAEELSTAAAEDAERWEPVCQDVIQVQKATERAIALTHQLLTFGRREVVRPRVLDLNDVVTEIEQLLRRSIGEHVKLNSILRPGLWSVRADPGQIEQVLVNLAVNARDAMSGGGTLTLETDNIFIDAEYASRQPELAPGPYVRLRISDTGTGMPREVIAHAFEPFFSTKPKGRGSGLGLATVYGIITQAGGTVRIYSEPGLGTTISMLIPATDEAPQAEDHSHRPPRVTGAGETVLVVEDEDAMREVARRILERNGYHVITTGDGSAAVELVRSHAGALDLLLTDVVMPQMLGKEVASQIRFLRPEVRVLYMSGYARPVLAEQGTLGNGLALVEKPFSEDALLQAVREVLDGPAEVPDAQPDERG